MSGACDETMPTRSSKACGLGGAIGCRYNAVGVTIKRDRRHRDWRQLRQPALNIGIARIACRKAVAMTVAVDRDVDKIGIIECGGGALEGCCVEPPVGRPLLPENLCDFPPVGGKAGTAAFDLKIILIPVREFALRRRRLHGVRDVLD